MLIILGRTCTSVLPNEILEVIVFQLNTILMHILCYLVLCKGKKVAAKVVDLILRWLGTTTSDQHEQNPVYISLTVVHVHCTCTCHKTTIEYMYIQCTCAYSSLSLSLPTLSLIKFLIALNESFPLDIITAPFIMR